MQTLQTGGVVTTTSLSTSTVPAVTTVTRGRLVVRLLARGARRELGMSAVLLLSQFCLQLFVAPQLSVLGKAVFIVTVAASATYNWYVCRQSPRAWERFVLEDLLKGSSMTRYTLGTRTAAATFLMRLLSPMDVEQHLRTLIPNNSPVWRFWRHVVGQKVREASSASLRARAAMLPQFSPGDRELLAVLLDDAEVGLFN